MISFSPATKPSTKRAFLVYDLLTKSRTVPTKNGKRPTSTSSRTLQSMASVKGEATHLYGTHIEEGCHQEGGYYVAVAGKEKSDNGVEAVAVHHARRGLHKAVGERCLYLAQTLGADGGFRGLPTGFTKGAHGDVYIKIYNGALLGLTLQLLQALHLLCFQELVDTAEVFAHTAMAELIDLGGQAIEEVAVVAHADECAVEVL